MKCPHCLLEMHPQPRGFKNFGSDPDAIWSVDAQVCPACDRFIITLREQEAMYDDPDEGTAYSPEVTKRVVVYPRHAARPISPKVPKKFAKDFNEAAAVLADSPNASAALSRRCLQNLVREQEKIHRDTLNDEIDELLEDGKRIPQYIALDLHTIRRAGNVAVHPMKHKETGIVADVEPWEADYLLNILENLFEFYFVKPEETLEKREKIAEKYKLIDKTGKKARRAEPDTEG